MTDWMRNLPAELPEQLAEAYSELLERKEDLLSASGRVPAICDNDEIAARMTDFVSQMMAVIKTAQKAHKIEKEPHLQAGRVVDKFFRDIVSPLETIKGAMEALVGSYQFRKQEAIKRAAMEAERLAREEAERQAAAMQTEADLAEAIAQDEAAREQAAIVAARPIELSRLHGDLATGSLRIEYDYAIENLDMVPRRFLMLNESAVKAHIRSRPQDGAPEPIPGLRFIARHVTRVRS